MLLMLLTWAAVPSSVFTPKGWDNIARGNAPGTTGGAECTLKGCDKVRRIRVAPFQGAAYFVAGTQGFALGYVVPPLRGGATHFNAAQPKVDYPALRQRLLRGNYAEARTGYEALLKEEK